MQQKTGRVEPGITRTEEGETCRDVRHDGEPCANQKEQKGDLSKLAQAMQTTVYKP